MSKPMGVTFIGDYFSLTTWVEWEGDTSDWEGITDQASERLEDQYGWQVKDLATVDIWIEEK